MSPLNKFDSVCPTLPCTSDSPNRDLLVSFRTSFSTSGKERVGSGANIPSKYDGVPLNLGTIEAIRAVWL